MQCVYIYMYASYSCKWQNKSGFHLSATYGRMSLQNDMHDMYQHDDMGDDDPQLFVCT